MTYFKNLDGVRAIAALMVMIYHFCNGLMTTSQRGEWWLKGVVFGQTGVTLFFVLSGFLITRILLSSKSKDGYFSNFFARRTLRIFPLYYGYLALHYFVVPLFIPSEPVLGSQQWPYWLYLQNFAMTYNWDALGPWHFWSLAIEEHFYLFWPFAVYFLSEKGLFRFIIGIIIFSIGLRAFMNHEGYEVFYLTFTRFDSLAIGSLLALMELRTLFTPKYSKTYLSLGALATFLMIGGWIVFDLYKYAPFIESKYLFTSLAYFFGIAYVLSLKVDANVNNFLSGRFLIFSGKISYGLYVYHPLAFGLATYYLKGSSWGVILFLSFVFSYGMAFLSFYLFENQLLQLKKYFVPKITSASSTKY